jgi:hypothetical protein
MSDEVIRELWRVKDELAKEFNYDIGALAAEIRRRDKESGETIVDLSRHGGTDRASGKTEPLTIK